jgi:hypothetical protein
MKMLNTISLPKVTMLGKRPFNTVLNEEPTSLMM